MHFRGATSSLREQFPSKCDRKSVYDGAMDYRRQDHGLLTFLEHWWFLGVVMTGLLGLEVVAFFTTLSGTPWIWCYGVSLAVAVVGIALVFYAKLPLYRARRFFTFGRRALPDQRRRFYSWGYRCVGFAIALLTCLLLSRP
jgi:MFS family permease